MSLVSLQKVSGAPNAFFTDLEALLAPFGGIANFVFPGAHVVLLPDVRSPQGTHSPEHTAPELVAALVELLRQQEIEDIRIACAAEAGIDTMAAFATAGYDRLADLTGVKLVDLKQEETASLPVPEELLLPELALPASLLQADVIINLPKLKTTAEAGFCCGMENLLGALNDYGKERCGAYDFDRALVDLYQVLHPQLTVVDGVVGSSLGTPMVQHLLVAGVDLVTVDTVTAICAVVDPDSLPYLVLASQYGFGMMDPADIRLIGPSPYEVQMKYAL